MKTLREHFWIWGHPAGSLNIEGSPINPSDLAPVEGTYYLGAQHIFSIYGCTC